MKVAVGISGGVDSTVAALLLKEQGHELVGVTMTLGRADEEKSLSAARAAAERLGISLKVRDFSQEWHEQVVEYLKAEYLAGRTPNPCIRCNEFIKFGLLPRWAFSELGCERFATGHYARLENGHLLRAVDLEKDQSYFLYRVKPEILSRTIFPLGNLKKGEVREIARRAGFDVADRADSQDFCGGSVAEMMETEPRIGNIVTAAGKVLGQHKGFWNYTVGKRKGLGIGGGIPYYVIALRPATNEVVVGFRDEINRRELNLESTVGEIDLSKPVKVRSAGAPKLLAEGIAGIAPGQSAVFFDGERILGGGVIQ